MRNDAGINGDAQRIEQIAWMLFLKVYDAKEQDWEFDDSDYTSIIPENCRWSNWAHDDKSGNAMTGDPLLDFVNNTLFPTLKNLPVTKETPIKKAIVQTTFADANNYMKDGVLLRQVLNVIDALDLGDYEESHAFGEIYEAILKELQSAGSAGEFYTPRAVTDFMAKMIKPQIGEKMADFACGTGGFLTSWLKELEKQVKSVADQEEYGDSIYGIEKKQFPYMLCITNMLLHDIDVPRVFHDNSLTRDLSSERIAEKGDILFTVTGSYGIPIKVDCDKKFCFQRHIALLKLLLDWDYMFLLLKSPVVKNQCDTMATGTAQKTVGLRTLRSIVLPLPPLAEQKRIVQKLEEILPLCEKLK